MYINVANRSKENVDWSGVTLTSILKKIVPEEVFKENNEEITETKMTVKHVPLLHQLRPNSVKLELKLLDKDQLRFSQTFKHFNRSNRL